MEQIAEEIISPCVAAAGIYLTAGPVLLAVELPIGSSAGTPQAMAHGVERAVVIVVCFVAAGTAGDRGSRAAPRVTVVNDNGDAVAMGLPRHAGGAANRRRGYKVAYPCLA